MKPAVLLLAHGAPERVEDVEQYLGFVRSGRPSNPQITEEVRHRLAAIGGSSPLLGWTRAQAEALQKLLGIPVFFGMRNWHPFIHETMEKIRDAGVDRVVAICMAPQYSELSVGLYIKHTQAASEKAGVQAEFIWARSFHNQALLIEAFSERLQPLLAPHRQVLFTAHSLPEKALADGDPYETEARATAGAVAVLSGLKDWDFAFQSQGMTSDRWLGPTVEASLERYAGNGVREVVIQPVGFVCDHIEVLYDIDIAFRDYARKLGMRLLRPESLNDSPIFTAALAEVVRGNIEL